MKKKKVGIITIIDNENCGNRLQNYALQEILKNLNVKVCTLRNDKLLNSKEDLLKNYLRYIKKLLINNIIKRDEKRYYFKQFNKLIKFSKRLVTCNSKRINSKYDYFIAGSDQIWKPTRKRMSYVDLLGFASEDKRISYAASFGLNSIETKYYDYLKSNLFKFKAISVREEAGKQIIKEATGLENVEVVIDPTMLLNEKQWLEIEKKPKGMSSENYIFTYFLGTEDLKEIERKFDKIKYNIVDFYKGNYGPQEFIYLIHNAKYIITDSFHGAVFSIIFNKNFWVVERKEKTNNNNMNSRIDTLLKTFNLNANKVNNISEIVIEENNMNYNISTIMANKQRDGFDFLKRALDIEDNNNAEKKIED